MTLGTGKRVLVLLCGCVVIPRRAICAPHLEVITGDFQVSKYDDLGNHGGKRGTLG